MTKDTFLNSWAKELAADSTMSLPDAKKFLFGFYDKVVGFHTSQLPTQEVGVSEEFYESFMRELTYTQRIAEGDKVTIMPIRFKRTAEEVLGWIKTRINSSLNRK